MLPEESHVYPDAFVSMDFDKDGVISEKEWTDFARKMGLPKEIPEIYFF